MGSNTSTPSGFATAAQANTRAADSPPSPFICHSHNGYIPFGESWEITDSCNFCCQQCIISGRIIDGKPRARGAFRTPGSFFGQNPALVLTCGKCSRTASQAYALGWMFCMGDEASFCPSCLQQNASLLRNHRLGPRHVSTHSSSSRQPASWVLFAHPKPDNDVAQQRHAILAGQAPPPSARLGQDLGLASPEPVSWVRMPANAPWGVVPGGSGTRNTLCDAYDLHRGGPTIGPTNSQWYACARCKPGWDALARGQ
ncbi:hypothetical protein B0T26DRAFT_726203 [Lasiosphaeria miniovina]|uniref:Uncharacterized protein n=1 Tax=Lasiosphaeria miniovina TaxID=1954250 RepID=A0AA39ZZ41_9PEZI|nr:uncharacterized protein B0T26DRAFT_726203 [Lasiosphaeria miniovina]KAK0706321.1 hypothetical protein B0T26DRAFT_726203 [Lasiosphaeria miniovina]